MTEELNPYQATASVSRATVSPFAVPEELKRVHAGLYSIYYGIVTILGIVIGGPLLMILANRFGFEVGVVLIAMSINFVVMCGTLSIFVGQILCLSVPANSGSRMAIVCSVTLQGVMFLSLVASFVMVAVTGVVAEPNTLATVTVAQLASALCGLVSYAFLLAFLRRLNLHLGNLELIGSADFVLKLVIASFVFGFLTFLLGTVAASTESFLFLALALLGLVASLLTAAFAFAKFSSLVIYTAKAIEKMPSRPKFEFG